jgi:hypothetical protein
VLGPFPLSPLAAQPGSPVYHADWWARGGSVAMLALLLSFDMVVWALMSGPLTFATTMAEKSTTMRKSWNSWSSSVPRTVNTWLGCPGCFPPFCIPNHVHPPPFKGGQADREIAPLVNPSTLVFHPLCVVVWVRQRPGDPFVPLVRARQP